MPHLTQRLDEASQQHEKFASGSSITRGNAFFSYSMSIVNPTRFASGFGRHKAPYWAKLAHPSLISSGNGVRSSRAIRGMEPAVRKRPAAPSVGLARARQHCRHLHTGGAEMDGKRATRAAQWRAHVSAWRSSGQTQAGYCAAHGLSASALGYWIRRLREAGDGSAGARLTWAAARPMTALVPPADEAPLTLHSPSGWSLVFGSRPPAAWLRELLGAERAE